MVASSAPIDSQRMYKVFLVINNVCGITGLAFATLQVKDSMNTICISRMHLYSEQKQGEFGPSILYKPSDYMKMKTFNCVKIRSLVLECLFKKMKTSLGKVN